MVASSKLCPNRPEPFPVSTSAAFPALGLWQFPQKLAAFYRGNGVASLFQWQINCLTQPGVLEAKRNLVFAAPTSAGKTLVAEILMWKRLTETRRKAIYIVPFVSVGREKVVYLQALFKAVGLKVDAYIGSLNSVAGITSWDVAVCTIEKANNLINRCIEENTLDLIGTIVIDEFHIIGDPHRGYLVELLVSKILQMKRLSCLEIQLVAMSATISNLTFLCRWIDAIEYTTDFRPITLTETIFTDGFFCDRDMNKIRSLPKEYILPKDPDNVIGLCLETVVSCYGVLIFCATKNWCEKLSENIAATFANILQKTEASHLAEKLRTSLTQMTESNFLAEYKRIVGIVDPLLARTVPYGVAFHHAGLTMEEREQLERGFRSGYIRVLVATSTLSSGVNLPARRVIIRSPWGYAGAVAGPSLTHSAYKQMVGRSGRQGIDLEGESVIVCKPQEVKRAQDLMRGALESVESALVRRQQAKDGNAGTGRFKRVVLEAIVGNFAKSIDDVVNYANCTLMAAEISEGNSCSESIRNYINDSVNYLLTQQFIALEGDQLTATQLGRATLASAMNPDEAWMMFQDLKQAQRSLVLESELHMVYLVTPTYMQDQWGPDFDWYRYHNIWCRLSDDHKHVAEVVGVSEAFILLASRRHGMTRSKKSVGEERRYAIHMRFYTALALYELIEERPINAVAETFGCNRGFLQALQQQAATYAGMTIAFCDRLGWWYMKSLLTGFAERIAFGVRRELTELVQIDGIDGSRARCFHHCSFTTLASLVYAKSKDIAAALRKAVPFKSGKEANGTRKRCWLAGHPEMGEDDAVDLIQTRAKSLLEENLSRFGISLEKCGFASIQRHPSDPVITSADKATEDGISDCPKNDIRCTIPSNEEQLQLSGGKLIISNENKSFNNDDKKNGDQGSTSCSVVSPAAVKCEAQGSGVSSHCVSGSSNDAPAGKLEKDVHSKEDHRSEPSRSDNFTAANLDDLDEVVMNMSRVSLTPRSDGEATPASSKRNSTSNRRSDFDLTESQFARIFTCDGSPILQKANVASSLAISRKDENQAENRSLANEVGPVVNGDASVGRQSQKFVWRDLPSSLSNNDVDKIRKDSDDHLIIDAGDIDLFDEDSSSIYNISSASIEDAGAERKETCPSPDPIEITTSDSGVISMSQGSIWETNRIEFHTPVLQARKRPRALRCGSENSTPSPLLRKCARNVEANSSQCGQMTAGNQRSWPNVDAQLAPSGRDKPVDGKLSIVNCCSSLEAFSKFASSWRIQPAFSMVACTKEDNGQCQDPKNGFKSGKSRTRKSASCPESIHAEVVGIAVCWTHDTVYYMPLTDDIDTDHSGDNVHCMSANVVSLNERLRLLKRCLGVRSSTASTKIVFDYLHMQRLLGRIVGPVHCVRIADWLLSCGRSDSPPVNCIADLIARYSHRTIEKRDVHLAAYANAAAMFSIWPEIERQLKYHQLWIAYIETEMPSVTVVAEMESNGICFDKANWRIVSGKVKELSDSLECRAHELAGRKFSLSSYSDLAKILFVELNLPADGAGTTSLQSRRCRAQTGRRHYSTSKEILQKISPLHPLPRVVLDWRKLHGSLTSAIFPLSKRSYSSCENESTRVFGTYDWFTATGRVTMHEPSLQTVPRPFQVDDGGVQEKVNIRNLIVAEPGFVLLSADYSQLELRILAHLSEDERLLGILNTDDGDVFRIIASAWLAVPAEEVDSEQRQRAKKLCYGVIYGMGAKSLAEELEVSEDTAVGFMDAFKQQFPGVFGWMSDVIAKTRENGYVTTLTGRRRYLQAISNNNSVEQRLQAERQAINTSVQGSAADIFKAALRDVDAALRQRTASFETPYRLVLQLHDEIVIETKENLLDQVAETVRLQMEKCYRLKARLRVRLSIGKKWGELNVL